MLFQPFRDEAGHYPIGRESDGNGEVEALKVGRGGDH